MYIYGHPLLHFVSAKSYPCVEFFTTLREVKRLAKDVNREIVGARTCATFANVTYSEISGISSISCIYVNIELGGSETLT